MSHGVEPDEDKEEGNNPHEFERRKRCLARESLVRSTFLVYIVASAQYFILLVGEFLRTSETPNVYILALSLISSHAGVELHRLSATARLSATIVSLLSLIVGSWPTKILHCITLCILHLGDGPFVLSDRYRRTIEETPECNWHYSKGMLSLPFIVFALRIALK